MSVELSVATTNFMGDSYTFIDCPGSIEFVHDMRAALPAVDAAIVVCEADEKKIPQLQLILRELEEQKIPRFLFLNKVDKADTKMHELLKLLQPASRTPLILRQIPIWKGETITGFVDLALERAHIYKEHAPSEVVELTGEDLDREKTARFTMLETLSDHDDELMEQLLADIPPPRDKVVEDLASGNQSPAPRARLKPCILLQERRQQHHRRKVEHAIDSHQHQPDGIVAVSQQPQIEERRLGSEAMNDENVESYGRHEAFDDDLGYLNQSSRTPRASTSCTAAPWQPRAPGSRSSRVGFSRL